MLTHPVTGEPLQAEITGSGSASGLIRNEGSITPGSNAQAQAAAPKAAHAVGEHCATAVLGAIVQLAGYEPAAVELEVSPLNPAICSR